MAVSWDCVRHVGNLLLLFPTPDQSLLFCRCKRFTRLTYPRTTRGSLITTRLLIGAFEAGFYPTALAYLTAFYPPFDLAVRIALFYGQYAVAGAFSGAIGTCELWIYQECRRLCSGGAGERNV